MNQFHLSAHNILRTVLILTAFVILPLRGEAATLNTNALILDPLKNVAAIYASLPNAVVKIYSDLGDSIISQTQQASVLSSLSTSFSDYLKKLFSATVPVPSTTIKSSVPVNHNFSSKNSPSVASHSPKVVNITYKSYGVSEATLNEKLANLDATLRAFIFNNQKPQPVTNQYITYNQGATFGGNTNAPSQSDIQSITNNITNIIAAPTFSGPIVNNAGGTSTFAGGIAVGGNLSVAGSFNVTGTTTFTNTQNVNNLNASNTTSVNGTFTNATSTNLFASNFSNTNGSITNLIFTNATGTNGALTNLFATNLTGTNNTLTNLFSTNATTTNLAASNLALGGQTFSSLLGTGLSNSAGALTVTLSPFSTTNLAEGTNLYYTQGRFDTAFSGKSTTNLAEGSNLYYTQGRFDTAFGNKTTSNLAEGSNLYYTNSRVNSQLLSGQNAIFGNATTTNHFISNLIFGSAT